MNIDGFFIWFINEFTGLFSYFFSLLDNIQFMGISLLTFTISIFIIGTVLPIILTLVRGHVSGAKADARSEARYQEHQAQRQAQREAQRKAKKGG